MTCRDEVVEYDDFLHWDEDGRSHKVHGTSDACHSMREFFTATADLYKDWLRLARTHDPSLKGVPGYESMLSQLTGGKNG